jgi:hypothetical protein
LSCLFAFKSKNCLKNAIGLISVVGQVPYLPKPARKAKLAMV